jgi:hypothetical protein
MKPIKLENGTTIYAVPKGPGTSVHGWITETSQGWQPVGYEHPTPARPTPEEAVDDLVELISEEEDTADWPKRY